MHREYIRDRTCTESTATLFTTTISLSSILPFCISSIISSSASQHTNHTFLYARYTLAYVFILSSARVIQSVPKLVLSNISHLKQFSATYKRDNACAYRECESGPGRRRQQTLPASLPPCESQLQFKPPCGRAAATTEAAPAYPGHEEVNTLPTKLRRDAYSFKFSVGSLVDTTPVPTRTFAYKNFACAFPAHLRIRRLCYLALHRIAYRTSAG